MIDERRRMTAASRELVYSGQIALVSLLPPPRPPLPLVPQARVGLWEEDGPHGWVSSFWMAQGLPGREGRVVVGGGLFWGFLFFVFGGGRISFFALTAKQTNAAKADPHPRSPRLPSNR